ncbi:hypothetical protein [Aureimonas sp. N4]|uniref:hypothetical protein n=1 Tax=Aureimonas sp. N4 TaxID=1638165 RepID=UPI000AFE984C|nr:hypothetical protein [Aureimonas sp. N4]
MGSKKTQTETETETETGEAAPPAGEGTTTAGTQSDAPAGDSETVDTGEAPHLAYATSDNSVTELEAHVVDGHVVLNDQGDNVLETPAAADNGIAPAETFSPSGAPEQTVPDVDPSHPAVDADPRAKTTAEQNRIDFNDPTISGEEAVARSLAAQTKG